MISQVNVYVMDTVWRYYVTFMCGGQYPTDSQKAALTTCYIILLECKGP